MIEPDRSGPAFSMTGRTGAKEHLIAAEGA
jgi:hypothetical protein